MLVPQFSVLSCVKVAAIPDLEAPNIHRVVVPVPVWKAVSVTQVVASEL